MRGSNASFFCAKNQLLLHDHTRAYNNPAAATTEFVIDQNVFWKY